MKNLYDNFNNWYMNNKKNRKLDWRTQLGEVEIKSNETPKNFILEVNVYQAVIL